MRDEHVLLGCSPTGVLVLFLVTFDKHGRPQYTVMRYVPGVAVAAEA